MCNYVNPNCLGKINHFMNEYSNPIEKSRDMNCSESEKEIGDERSNSLNKITTSFILRRTSEAILKKYLKPKTMNAFLHLHTLGK